MATPSTPTVKKKTTAVKAAPGKVAKGSAVAVVDPQPVEMAAAPKKPVAKKAVATAAPTKAPTKKVVAKVASPASVKTTAKSAVKQPAKKSVSAIETPVAVAVSKPAPVVAKAKPVSNTKSPAKSAAQAVTTKAPAKRPAIQLYQVASANTAPVEAPCLPCVLPSSGNLPLIDAMRALQQDKANQSTPLWGLLPADFAQRTGLSAQAFQKEIEAHPGFDVYFCHAHPEIEALYHNAWLQAEVSRPNFLLLAREFLKAAGLPETPLDTLTHSSNFATGHLMVATPAVWAQYLDFIQQTVTKAKAKMGKTARAALFDEPVQPGKFSYLYLIVARLLGLMLTAKAGTLKAYKVALPQEKALNPHLRLLREMRDTAVARQSRWQVACWSNYRALYLVQTFGKPWLSEHMAAVSPKNLRLGGTAGNVVYAYTPTVEGAGK